MTNFFRRRQPYGRIFVDLKKIFEEECHRLREEVLSNEMQIIQL